MNYDHFMVHTMKLVYTLIISYLLELGKNMWVGLIQGCKLNPYHCYQVIAFWTSPKDMNRESSF
jgi:hypothetical protein